MSLVKIQGNASGTGTLTIAAPNTNSDYTLTLPASSGTVATLATVTNNGVAYVNSSGQPTSGSALTFDGSNLGLGVAASSWDSVFKSFDGGGSGCFGSLFFQANGDYTTALGSNLYYNGGWKYKATAAAGKYELKNNTHAWYTAPSGTAGNAISFTQAMTLDSSGNLLLGISSVVGASSVDVVRPANTATYIYMLKTGQVECTWGFKSSTDTNMYIGSGSTAVGTYGVYLTNLGNSWNSVSDERMKTIVEPIENAAEKVSSLRAVIGYYNNDENQTRRPFLIAQDVQAVLPEAVNIQDQETGTLGMSYTDTIPLLVAAIQELKAIVDAQGAEIAALKGTA